MQSCPPSNFSFSSFLSLFFFSLSVSPSSSNSPAWEEIKGLGRLCSRISCFQSLGLGRDPLALRVRLFRELTVMLKHIRTLWEECQNWRLVVHFVYSRVKYTFKVRVFGLCKQNWLTFPTTRYNPKNSKKEKTAQVSWVIAQVFHLILTEVFTQLSPGQWSYDSCFNGSAGSTL